MNLKIRNSKKRSKFLKIVALAVVVLLFLFGAIFVIRKYSSQEAVINEEKAALPSPESRGSVVSSKSAQPPTTNNKLSADSIPEELNLDVPFTSQAPHANWDYTHEEACEEAAILMANRYFQGRGISGPDDAEAGLQEIIAWEKENLGFFESTTAKESERIITEMLGLKAEIIKNPTIEEIKRAIVDDKLVIVPAAGRELGNPFYKSPGPLYHFLLIKGYTASQFITNDAGTKRGANYPYNFDVVMSANHDWNGGGVSGGQRVVILVFK
ncbi:C39 family peptidase [Patescibacteria group bacterium]|nr:C39 family peptidase [Patescibacteria group bacterium]